MLGITDSSGTWIARYYYNAWGRQIYTKVNSEFENDVQKLAAADYNPLRYRSYMYDGWFDIYYLQSRYYSSEWGKFLNADLPEFAKVGKEQYSGTNLFAYCCNDPVNSIDPEGNKYSPLKAKEYAEKWWNRYNKTNYKFSSEGRDCANFVSQCLHYGGFRMTGIPVLNDGWHNYKKGRISDAWGIANSLYEWLICSGHTYKTYVISNHSDVNKAGKILYKRPCAAAVFFADNGKPIRKNINGKIQRLIFKNHAAINGEVIKYKKIYDIYYYAHSYARNGKRYYGKTRKYYSIKDYLDRNKGAKVYICMLK